MKTHSVPMSIRDGWHNAQIETKSVWVNALVSTKQNNMNTRLYVGHLSEMVTEMTLEDLFEAYDEVDEVSVLRRFGSVHFKKVEDATAGLDALDNSDFMGTHIKIQYSGPKHCGNFGHKGGYGHGANLASHWPHNIFVRRKRNCWCPNTGPKWNNYS